MVNFKQWKAQQGVTSKQQDTQTTTQGTRTTFAQWKQKNPPATTSTVTPALTESATSPDTTEPVGRYRPEPFSMPTIIKADDGGTDWAEKGRWRPGSVVQGAQVVHSPWETRDTDELEGLLTDYQGRLDALNTQISGYAEPIALAQTKLTQAQDNVTAMEKSLQKAEQERNVQQYNALIPYYQQYANAYNKAVDEYNSLVAQGKASEDEYNSLLHDFRSTYAMYDRARSTADDRAKQFQKKGDELQKQAEELEAYIEGRKALPPTYRQVTPDEMGEWLRETEELERKAKDLDDQIRWYQDRAAKEKGLYSAWQYDQEMNDYAALRQNSDFAEKSQYVPTGSGKQGVSLREAILGQLDTGYDDPVYEYVNGNEDAIEKVFANESASGMTAIGFDSAFLGQLHDDERELYNYIHATKGKDAADAFLRRLQSFLNERQREAKENDWREYAKKSPVGASAFSVLMSPTKVITRIMQAADTLANGGADENAGYNKYSYIPTAIRSEVSSRWGQTGSFLYNTGMSILDFLYNAALTGDLLGGGAEEAGKLTLKSFAQGMTRPSIVLMGMEAAADSYIANRDRGLDHGRAYILSAASGLIEALTENLSLETLLNPVQLSSKLATFAANTWRNALAEGSEELNSDLLNWAVDAIYDTVTGQDESEYKQKVRKYIQDGMSARDAAQKVLQDRFEEAALDTLGGMLSGGIMSAGQSAIGSAAGSGVAQDFSQAWKDTHQYDDLGKSIRGQGGIKALVQSGLRSDSPQANALAQDMLGKLAEGKSISNNDLGRLAAMLGTTASTEAQGSAPAQDTTAAAEAARTEAPTASQGNAGESTAPVITAAAPLTQAQEEARLNARDTAPVITAGTESTNAQAAQDTAPVITAGQNEQEVRNGQQAETAGADSFRARAKQAAAEWQQSNGGSGRRSSLGRFLEAFRTNREARSARGVAERIIREQASEIARLADEREAGHLTAISGEEAGLEDGNTNKTAYVIPERILTDSQREAVKKLADMGWDLNLISGQFETTEMNDKGKPVKVRAFVNNSTKQIYVQADHSRLAWHQLLDHEELHREIRENPELRKEIEDALLADKRVAPYLSEIIDKYAEAYAKVGVTDENEVIEELLADYRAGFDMLDPLGVKNLAAAKVAKSARETILQTEKTRSPEGRRGVSVAEETVNAGRSQSKNSIEMNYADEVQRWYDTTQEQDRMISPGYFTVGNTSDALKSIGIKDGKIYWRKYKVGAIMGEHPEIDIDVIKQVPEILEHPQMVMRSATRPQDSIVLFGNLRGLNGELIMAAVDLTPKSGGNMEADFSLITSAHSRTEENIHNLLKKAPILYLDKNGAKSWLMQLRVQFPSRQPSFGPIGTVTYTDDGVKIEGKTLEELGGEIDTKADIKTSREMEPEYNRTALLTEDTVDRWLKDYASKTSPRYAQAYVTRMTPDQFLRLTTSRTGRLAIEEQTRELDAEKLIEATRQNPLQLNISDGEVVGHEGRHRANALLRAGVKSIPVLVFDSSNKYSKQATPEMTLQGQDFGRTRSYATETLRDLTPLSYENRDKIVRDYGTQPATDRYQEKYNGRNTIQFSREITPEQDADYLSAVKSGDMETAQKMVNAAAKAAGFTTPRLYHGTRGFGFTVFDTSKSDDNISLFATSSPRTAETYSGETKRNRISDRSNINVDSLSGERLLDAAKQHLNRYQDYRLMTRQDKEVIRKDARQDILATKKEAQEFINDHDGAFDLAKEAVMDRLTNALTRLASAGTEETIEKAWDDWNEAVWDFKDMDDSLAVEFLDAIGSKSLFFAKNHLADLMYSGDMYMTGDAYSYNYIFDNQLALELDAELHKGIYELFGKPGKQLVIDAKGENWNQITPPDELNLYGPQRTRDIAAAAKANGYDSVLFKGLRDNGGETAYNGTSDVYIFFNGNDMKSADPVTYDDRGGVIPLSERFNRKEQDIRYSIEMDPEEAARAERQKWDSLRQENEDLKKQVEKWKAQTKPSDRTQPREEDVRRMAKNLLKTYDSKADQGETMDALRELAHTVMSNDARWTDVKDQATRLARSILENSEVLVDASEADLNREIRSAIRSQKISFSGHEDIPDYNEWRKSNFGRLTISQDGLPVDVFWQELQERYGMGYFPDTITHPSAQVQYLADIWDRLQDRYENPFSSDMAEATQYLANDLIDRVISGEMRQAPTTYADRANAKVAREALKWELRTEKVKARLEAERQRRQQDIADLKEHYKTKEAKSRESRQSRELREKITKHARKMTEALLHPTDKRHIPDNLGKGVAAVLSAIDLGSGYSYTFDTNGDFKRVPRGLEIGAEETKRTQAFMAVREALLKEAEGLVMDPELLGTVEEPGALTRLVTELANIPIANMNSEQLQVVYNALRGVEGAVNSANKMLSNARWAAVSEAADAVRQENAGKTAPLELNGALGKVGDLTRLDMLTPEAYFHRFGKAGDAIFKLLRSAQDAFTVNMKNAVDDTQRILGDTDIGALEKEKHTLTMDGQQVTMTTAQIMELYCLMQREQGLQHITTGGLMIEPTRNGLKKTTQAEPLRPSVDELYEAIKVLTPEQMHLADELQKYLSEDMAELGNEATLKVYGYKKFGQEAKYWKIRSNKNEIASSIEKETQTTSVANRGFTKAINPQATTSVKIGSIFDTYSQSVNDMATYAAWLAVGEDVNRIRNYVFRDENGERAGTVKGILDRVIGSGGANYLQRLMADIANGAGMDDAGLTSGFVGAYKAAAIGANIRVIIQQPTAILRAAEMIDPKYLASGLKNPMKAFERAKQYSPIAQWKDWGYFDINTGRKMKDVLFENPSKLEKVRQASMALAGKADSFAWGQLWAAVEAETKDKTDITPGTKEFYQACAERFNNIIDHTQVVDGILQRSQIMRSKNAITRMAVSFMSEPTKQYNQFMSAVYDYKHNGNKKQAKQMMARTTFSMLAAGVANVLAQSLIDALRNSDRDKKYWEKLLQAFLGYNPDDETFGEKFKTFAFSNMGEMLNPASYLPYAKDVMSIIQGYSVDRMDMDGLSDTITAMTRLYKAMHGEGKQTVGYSLVKLGEQASKLLGLPAYNLDRDITSLFTTIINDADMPVLQYYLNRYRYKPSASGNLSADLKGILWDAKQKGDGSYDIIVDHMLKDGYEQETIDKAMTQMLADESGFTAALKEADAAGDNNESYNLAEKLEAFSNTTLSEEDRDILLQAKLGENQYAAFRAIMDSGLSFDETIRVFKEYNLMNSDDDSKAAENAKDFALWVDKQDYTESQSELIKETLRYWQMFPAKAERYEKFSASGLDEDTAYALDHALSELEPEEGHTSVTDTQKWEAVFDVIDDADEQKKALKSLMDETQLSKFEAALKAGVSPEVYVKFKVDTKDYSSDRDKDGKEIKGQTKKDKTVTYINKLKISAKQKDALYLDAGYKESTLNDTPWHKGSGLIVTGGSGGDKDRAPVNQSGLRLPPMPEPRRTQGSGLVVSAMPERSTRQSGSGLVITAK